MVTPNGPGPCAASAKVLPTHAWTTGLAAPALADHPATDASTASPATDVRQMTRFIVPPTVPLHATLHLAYVRVNRRIVDDRRALGRGCVEQGVHHRQGNFGSGYLQRDPSIVDGERECEEAAAVLLGRGQTGKLIDRRGACQL